MPLILFLLQHIAPTARAARRVEPAWQAQLAGETKVIARARSLYLVRWFFVEDLPLRDDQIGVWITNLGSLRARLRGGRADGPSLLAPAAGLAAGLAGSFTSPVLSPGLARLSGSRLLEALNALTGGLLISVGALVGGPFAVPAQAGMLDGLGRVAEALEPRPVHPLAKAASEVGDKLAALGAQLLGAFAVLATRVGPRLMPMALQAAAVKAIAFTLVDLILVTYENTLAHLKVGLGGAIEVFEHVFATVSGAFTRLGDRLEGAWRAVLDAIVSRAGNSGLGAWQERVQSELLSVVPQDVFKAIGERLDAITTVIEKWKTIDTTRGFLDALLEQLDAPFSEAVKPLAGLAFPTPGEFQRPKASLPGQWKPTIDLIVKAPWHRPIPASAYHSSAVFSSRLAALPAPDRKPLRMGIEELQAYQALAERAVAPGALDVVPKLLDVMVRIDERREHPVKALPENRVLAPRVGKLRVRAASREQAAAFGESLRGALLQQTYLVPAES